MPARLPPSLRPTWKWWAEKVTQNTVYFSPGFPCISKPETVRSINRNDSPNHWLLSAGSRVSVVLSPVCLCHARLHLDTPRKYWFQPSLAQLAAGNTDVTQKRLWQTATNRMRRSSAIHWNERRVSATWCEHSLRKYFQETKGEGVSEAMQTHSFIFCCGLALPVY